MLASDATSGSAILPGEVISSSIAPAPENSRLEAPKAPSVVVNFMM
jgi:hypothetical protein